MHILLLLFLSISIVSILIINFFLGDIKEFWNYGEEIGSVISDLSVGYIAAFIFYVIDIWIPERNTRKKVH